MDQAFIFDDIPEISADAKKRALDDPHGVFWTEQDRRLCEELAVSMHRLFDCYKYLLEKYKDNRETRLIGGCLRKTLLLLYPAQSKKFSALSEPDILKECWDLHATLQKGSLHYGAPDEACLSARLVGIAFGSACELTPEEQPFARVSVRGAGVVLRFTPNRRP